jgi:hypothetical protein
VIVGSLLLILVAVTLLVFGLAKGSSSLLISSIAASLLAAVALVVGARQAAAARANGSYPGTPDDEPYGGEMGGAAHRRTRVRTAERVDVGVPDYDVGPDAPPDYDVGRDDDVGRDYDARESTATVEVDDVEDAPRTNAAPTIPVQAQGNGAGRHHQADRWDLDDRDAEYDDEDDPPDEPPPQYVSPADAARVARLATEVLVIDGRPRYHLPGCEHLLGRESEPLPVAEAVELGFSPCSLCAPNSALLAGARRA